MQGRKDNRRIMLAILGAGASVVLFVGLFALVNHGDSFAGDAGSVLGWTFPVASFFVVIGVAWLLLSQSPRDPGQHPLYAPCPTCGRSVMTDWRLCPYCGEILERDDAHEALRAG